MESVYIIAEAGVNHNGDVELAKQMVLKAKEVGADAIKFQTFITENLVTKYAEKAQYQKTDLDIVQTQYQMLKRVELTYENFRELKILCESINIDFLSTPFDLESIDLLESLGIARYKISSGDITNYPYLVYLAKKHKPVILSTGMSTLKEVEEAVRILEKYGSSNIILLHCNTQYPTPVEDVNLNVIKTLKEKFQRQVGYSDHTIGIEVPIAAVAMGAQVIEKHFTMDRTMEGPDHKASIEPEKFLEMVRAIRNVELAIGDGIKRPTASEISNIVASRKSIVASRKIKKGEIFCENNISTKRPGNGISPMRWMEIIGKNCNRDFEKDEMIE